MKSELRRVVGLAILLSLSLILFSLNLSGYLISLTKATFYMSSILFIFLTWPDFVYMIKVRRGGDWVDMYQMFIKNSYRYPLVIFALYMILQLGSNIILTTSSSFNSKINSCLHDKGIKVASHGLYDLKSFRVKRNVTSIDVEFTVGLEFGSKKVRFSKNGSAIECWLL